MTDKKYPLIHIGQHSYMVDKEALIQVNDWFYVPRLNKIFKEGDSQHEKGCFKILASDFKSLGLPLLPEIEGNIEEIANKYIEDNYNSGATGGLSEVYEIGIPAFIAGHKANPKKYTADDMMNLATSIFESFNSEQLNEIKMRNEHGREKNTAFKIWVDNYLTSLNSHPIAVVVKMKPVSDEEDIMYAGGDYSIKPKVVDGKIQIKEYVYE